MVYFDEITVFSILALTSHFMFSGIKIYSIFLFWLVVKICRNHLHLLKKAKRLPSLKLRFYDLLGQLPFLYSHRWKSRSNSTSMHIQDFQVLCGHAHLFSREGLAGLNLMHQIVLLYRADTVEAILNNIKEIKKSWLYKNLQPWLGNSVLLSEGEKWKSRRKLLTPIFHFNILKNNLHIMNKHSKALSDVFESATNQEFVDIVPLFSNTSFNIIFEYVLDKPSTDQSSASYNSMVKHLTTSVLERIHNPWYWNKTTFNISPLGRKFLKVTQESHNFVNKVIYERREHFEIKRKGKSSTDDSQSEYLEIQCKKTALIDILLKEHLRDNTFTEKNIREELETILFGGHDTTSAALSWCLWLLGLHPWVQDKVHRELNSIFGEDNRDATLEDLKNMKYLECVIKESHRLYPPVPMIGREAQNGIEIGNSEISDGDTIIVNLFLLHRDPEVFPDPERFDPERFLPENSVGRRPFSYIPFSAGPRNCLGQKFANLEMKTVLSSILRKYKFRSLDPRDKIDYLGDIILRPTKGLRLQVRKRDRNFDFLSVYYFTNNKNLPLRAL